MCTRGKSVGVMCKGELDYLVNGEDAHHALVPGILVERPTDPKFLAAAARLRSGGGAELKK